MMYWDRRGLLWLLLLTTQLFTVMKLFWAVSARTQQSIKARTLSQPELALRQAPGLTERHVMHLGNA